MRQIKTPKHKLNKTKTNQIYKQPPQASKSKPTKHSTQLTELNHLKPQASQPQQIKPTPKHSINEV